MAPLPPSPPLKTCSALCLPHPPSISNPIIPISLSLSLTHSPLPSAFFLHNHVFIAPSSGSPPPSRGSGLNFPDLFQSFNNADAILGPMPEQTAHSLSQIMGCCLNMDKLGPFLKKSIGPLLITDGVPFSITEPFDGTYLLTDIQMLQRTFGIFNDALEVINSQDVVVKKVGEMKLLVQLKIGGLWTKGVIVHPCVEGSALDEIKKLGSDYGITVQKREHDSKRLRQASKAI